MSSSEDNTDTRRQSSRLKSRPLKNLKEASYSILGPDSDENNNKNDELGSAPVDPSLPLPTTTTKRKNLKRIRDEESFRIGNDIEPPRKRSKLHKLLLTIPLDLLYTIFSYLPPKSLLSLACVNRAFRSTLLSPETTFIWTRVRKSCKAPEPWEEMGEIEWVRLLFGGTHCQLCGSRNIPKIEFMLMKRICLSCVRQNGISKRNFKNNYPDGDKKVLDLVIAIDGGRKASHTRYYNCSEIEHVLEKMKACQDEKELEIYIEERTKYLERLTAHVDVCSTWMANDYWRQVDDAVQVKEERFTAIKSRLKEMGSVDEDIDSIKSEPGVSKDTPLTEQGWIRIRKKLSESVLDFRVRRLLNNNHSTTSTSTSTTPFVASRCALITHRYHGYKRSVLLHDWPDLPSNELVWCLPSMKKIIGLPDDVEVTAETVEDAATHQQFAREIREAIQGIKAIVDQDYFPWSSGRGNATAPWVPSDLSRGNEYDTTLYRDPTFTNDRLLPLDPATIQARCFLCRRVCTSAMALVRHLMGVCYLKLEEMVGRPGALAGRRRGYYERAEIFHSRTAAGLLVETLGVEALTVTGDVEPVGSSEMDDRGAMYRCLRCEPKPESDENGGLEGNGSKSGFVGTWRECIIHAFEGTGIHTVTDREEIGDHAGQSRDNPAFRILSNDEVSESGLKDKRRCWSCAHCTLNVGELSTREEMMAHLGSSHHVSEPKVPRDFFYSAWDERSTLTSSVEGEAINQDISMD
ncbi:hypothetical protein AAF712_016448 [Marasmius tenuissimus]|uniref:F-box domain-containing protein n=1 Tax=Marasmius tenuissimus TaxID=585030 RepID=A0ABR2Z7F7_9AGAR